jgi:hypothetical protein
MIEYKVSSTEHLVATLRSKKEVLDSQTVTISIDGGVTWLDAEWVGEPDFQRDARTLTPVTLTGPRRGEALAKVNGQIVELGAFMVTSLS